ncbi:flavin containing amine oxidase [Aspergillus bombycis]|uniref:Flavin containing amine oxidase n=1 Tax=Aspergillus bombycis TaxID=109264 RepID=A0A1F7ZIE5_9EURO|nr:flavin containing amine oxidase [Aspergillus bombycis]OGM39221.1 flavin containing amine oxidase [Aspergillus bombycis]
MLHDTCYSHKANQEMAQKLSRTCTTKSKLDSMVYPLSLLSQKSNPVFSGINMSKSPHVAIIGAGFSGLRCADILIQNGARVTIFEARNRVGGRVHQSKVGGRLIDLGPNWIHGTGTNPIAAIAEMTKTTMEDFEGNQVFISMDGSPIDDNTATKISEFVWMTIDEAFKYSNAYKDSIPPERSLLDFFLDQVEKANFTPEEKKWCIETCRLWGAYVGDPIERQSLKFFCLEECIDGNNYFVASTYKDILAYVSRAALQHADIRFNQPITNINSNVQPDPNAPHKTTLTTTTGETHTAPSPSRPSNRQHLLWPLRKGLHLIPPAFWHKNPNDLTTGGVASYSAYERPTFAQFLDPTYTKGPEGILWNQECLSLAALPGDCAHPTLLFYTYGPCATYIVSKVANLNPSSQEYYDFLDDFLRPFYSRLYGYSESSPDCKPLAVMATQWQNDPYAGNGSYCNFQVGLSKGDRDIEILRAGLGPDRGVWFAGEHTAPFVALGTTTGAYWSGERAAGQICQLYGLGRLGLGLERDDSLPSASGKGVVTSVD